ncbi:M20/M25/M40 family metallo-hydrolase [Paenibacillus sp. 481]|uniref:M20/M25/M40 family metallo-hydrolase n=1 Tax=Paenibacillus sp. 481 TaxID=2835869 RepID=UPI001E495744|nr:M20/M25/M40 family metallo-hydrolase [Paenibacillus sp. 481]UHA74599.1 M20/M25/M40 family metallo-hydrolase [Paenibacillus sp. 481]
MRKSPLNKVKMFVSALLGTSLLFSSAVAFAAPAPKQQEKPKQVKTIWDNMNANKMYNDIKHLSKAPRVAGTDGEYKAVQYIHNRFKKLGYETKIQQFEFKDWDKKKGKSHNVIATLKPNTSKKTNEIVIIGAHHDSVKGSPGAIDDASGVAVILELARLFADQKRDTEIRFVSVGAEEFGLYGAKHYVNTLSQDEIKRIVGQFHIDMVGNKAAKQMAALTVDGKKNIVTDLGATFGQKYANKFSTSQISASDHAAFAAKGIPAAVFSHMPLDLAYHAPTDTIDKISNAKLREAATVVGASVYKITDPATPSFKQVHTFFTPVDYKFISLEELFGLPPVENNEEKEENKK